MKKHIFLVLTILIYSTLQAQKTGSYINFNVGGGFHNLPYNLNNGSEKGQFGYTINAGYSFFFTPQWGLHTGIGFQKFNSLSTLNYLSSIPDIDSDGSSYVFKANYSNLQERQEALFVDVPLSIQFKVPVSSKFGILTSLGGKVSIPVNTTFKTTGGQLITTGYYSQWNVELSDMPQHGFATYTKKFTGDLALKTSYMATADLGGLYKLSEKLDFYVGGYINYGLNNILKANNKLVYQPGIPDGVYNGIFASTQTTNVVPISIGLKVGVYFHLTDNKSTLDFVKPIDSVEPVKTVEPDKIVETVKPAASVQPEEAVAIVQPTEPIAPVQVAVIPPSQPVQEEKPIIPVQEVKPTVTNQEVKTSEPVKVVNPVFEATLTLTPTVVEPVKEVNSVEATTPVEKTGTVQNDVPFQEASMIAESINVMFGFNSYRVTNAKNDKIKELSKLLKANSYIHVRFVGHTCNIGSHEINLNFGMKRATSVEQKFLDQGVPQSQLIGESKAYDQPLAPNNSKSNRAKNRRVVISVFK